MKIRKVFLVVFALAVSSCASPVTPIVGKENCASSRHLQELVVKITVLHAKAENYVEARRELEKLTNYETLMSKIIKSLYNGQQSNIKYCLLLLRGVDCDAYANGISALYDEMKLHSHLSEPEVLEFVEYLQSWECFSKTQVTETNSKLQPHLHEILTKWALDIRNGSYQHIYQSFDWQQYYRKLDSLSRQMPMLTQLAFGGNESNFPATLGFIRSSPHLVPEVQGLHSLTKELKKIGKSFSGEMFEIAKQFYLIFFSEEASAQDNAFVHQYDSAVDTVPTEIRDIFWKNKCLIDNEYNREFLVPDESSMSVYTWIPGSRVRNGDWYFEAYRTEERNVNFKLRNTYSEHYVGMDITSKFGLLTTNATQDGIDWEIRPSLTWEGQKVFLLQNKLTKDYLSAGSIFDFGRNLRSVIVRDSIEPEVYWKIICEE